MLYILFFFLDKCADTEFKCFNGACVASDLVCDGNYDCSDSSDELTCDNGRVLFYMLTFKPFIITKNEPNFFFWK